MNDATIELIDSVTPHPNADRLDLCKILGYTCVSQKDLYKGGEKIVYIRPDSLLPIEEWTVEYRKYSPNRIKCVKLRGEFSEGIIVPFEMLSKDRQDVLNTLEVGNDVSELIGVTHYEPPAPTEANAVGGLPYGIPKTDETRWENIVSKLPIGESVDVTLKIDGQSWSLFYSIEDDRIGVLGRTLEYDAWYENRYSVHVLKTYPDIIPKLKDLCRNTGKSLCIRGESYGKGIQAFSHNPHNKLNNSVALYSVYNITDKKYERKGSDLYFTEVADQLGVEHVSIVEKDKVLTQELIDKYSTGIEKLEGLPFEGVVINHANGSFKIINKAYDTKK